MSILSKSQFDKLCSDMQNIQQKMDEQSKNIQNKIILTISKIDYLEQSIEGLNQKNLHEGADKLIKIHEQYNNTRNDVNKLTVKFDQQIKQIRQQFDQQLMDLKLKVQASQEIKIKQLKNLQTKLNLKIQEIQKQAEKQHQKQMLKINNLKSNLLQQLVQCEQMIVNSRNRMAQQETKLSHKLQQIHKDLQEKIDKLRSLRKTKKQGFLELLQSVIFKIKQSSTFQI